MKLGFIDSYYFSNSELLETKNPSILRKPKFSVYEVIRIIGGYPLFIEDHIDRLFHSLQKLELNSDNYTLQNFKNKIASLCEANQKYFGNIELRVSKLKNKKIFCFIGFIPHKYPEPLSYLEGVSVHLMNAQRKNPTAKVKGSKTRKKADKYLKKNPCFEVLLKNTDEMITEGSRSNFFYLIDQQLFSAPVDTVLSGITRKYVIQAAKNIGIPYQEKLLSTNEIKHTDAAFLSGTSLGILPIKTIDNNLLNHQNEPLMNLLKEYNNLVNAYLATYKL